MNHNKLGARIRFLRLQNKMTQSELAVKLNVTDKAVSKWERNLSYPDITLFPKLAVVLGVNINDLLNESIEEQEVAESTTKVEPTNLAKATPQKTSVKAKGTKGKKQSAKTSTTTSHTGKNVVVMLNNGATVVGKMVSFDPVESITVDVAGKRSTIPMNKVKSVETKD